MTDLHISMDRFWDACQATRGMLSYFEPDTQTIYAFYREMLEGDRDNYRLDPIIPANAASEDELRADLMVAARRLMDRGASERQVSYLAKLAWTAGDRSYAAIMGAAGHLSSRDASAMIDSYLRGE